MTHKRNASAEGAASESESSALLDALKSSESLALSVDPLAPRASLRDRVLGSTTYEGRIDPYVERTSEFFDVDGSRAREILASALDPASSLWVDDPTPNTRLQFFQGGPKLEGAACMLVHMQKGVAYPTHLHIGDEWCLFLGGRIVEAERELNPGDLVLNPAGSRHAVQHAVDDEPTVFGIVVYEGVRFDER